jgi:hypothetical protein
LLPYDVKKILKSENAVAPVIPQREKKVAVTLQQQQHSLLSQASWGRLEMKPKRDEKQEDT